MENGVAMVIHQVLLGQEFLTTVSFRKNYLHNRLFEAERTNLKLNVNELGDNCIQLPCDHDHDSPHKSRFSLNRFDCKYVILLPYHLDYKSICIGNIGQNNIFPISL